MVAALATVTVTEPWAAMLPRLQLRRFATSVQEPWLGVAVVKTRPPLPGSWSVRETFVAAALPAAAGLLTTIVKLTCAPCVKVPRTTA